MKAIQISHSQELNIIDIEKPAELKAGEVMRVGVKGSTNARDKNSWCIFDNFKLTFRAKNPEVVEAVLDLKSKELGALIYVTDADGNPTSTQTDEFLTTLSRIRQKAEHYYQQSQEIAGLTDDQKYGVMVNVNDIYNEVKANIQTQKDITDAKAQYDVAMNALAGVDPQGDLASEDLYDLTDDMEDNLYPNKESLTSDAELRTLCDSLITLTSMVYQEVEKIKIAGATDDEPLDMTSHIVNPGFEDDGVNETKTIKGWTNSGSQQAQTQSNGSWNAGKVGTYYCERWHVSGTVDINQALADLPAGTYELSAAAQSDADNAILYANSNSVQIENTAQRYSVIVKIEEGDTLKIGVTWTDPDKSKWTRMDDFKLTYFGAESQKEPTAIDFIDALPANRRNGKFFENGQLIIYRNGKKYNVAGQQLQ